MYSYENYKSSKNLSVWNDLNEYKYIYIYQRPTVKNTIDFSMPKDVLHTLYDSKGEKLMIKHGQIRNAYGLL